METMYIFGGYILTGGFLEDKNGQKKEWKGINIMLAEKRDKQEFPMYATVVKASRTDDMMRVISALAIGQPVHAYFSMPDANGKVKCTAIKAVQSK